MERQAHLAIRSSGLQSRLPGFGGRWLRKAWQAIAIIMQQSSAFEVADTLTSY